MASEWQDLEDFVLVPQDNGSEPLRLPRLMTHDDHVISSFIIGAVLTIAALMGVTTNGLNLSLFLKMNIHDSVTASFIGLSSSDFAVSFFDTVVGVSLMLFGFELATYPVLPIDPTATVFWPMVLARMAYVVTILQTMQIAVVRCICVVFPLQAKNLFTAKMSWTFIVLAWLFAISIYLAILFNMGFMDSFDPFMNRTRVALYMSPMREAIKDIVVLLTQSGLGVLTQFTLIICVIFIAISLKRSSKFRQESQLQSSEGNSGTLSGKDLQAVKQVMVLCSVYLMCNFFGMALGFLDVVLPDLAPDPVTDRYSRLHYVLQVVRITTDQMNSSVNFFIYFRYNTRFREIFRARFCS